MDKAIVEAADKILSLWQSPQASLVEFHRAIADLHRLTGAHVLIAGGMYEIKNYAEGIVTKHGDLLH